MIRYLYASELAAEPRLACGMFRHRAAQFRDRLDWAVKVDAAGEERDAYDALNALYVMWQCADGEHGGSMRLLPTTGPTMLNDHFAHLSGGGTLESPLIWECTRFCLAPGADAGAAAALMLAGGEVMEGFGVRHFVGVFDARMMRIYRHIGAAPDIIGSEGVGRAAMSVGLWSYSPEARARVAASAGIDPSRSRAWFEAAFGPARELAAAGTA